MVLALRDSPHGPLSMYQVSFNSLVYVQKYAPGKLFTAKIKKGSNSVNTVDWVTILALCTSPDGPLSVYQVSFIPLYTFRDMLRTNFLLQKGFCCCCCIVVLPPR